MKEDATELSVFPEDEEERGLIAEEDLTLDLERAGPSPLQIVRGTAGIAGIWAGAWAAMGLVFGSILSLFFEIPMMALLPGLFGWALSGFLTGTGFATLLTIMERKRTLEELSLLRVGSWGAIGGLVVHFLVLGVAGVIPYLWGIEALSAILLPWLLIEGVKAALLGAGSAVGTTWLAKRGDDEGPLLEPPSD